MSGEVIVVGGGVIGLTTAVVLAESGARVRVWTRETVELTTSAVAGALWWPYRIEPEALVGEWALQSLRVYEELAARPEETGVRMVEGCTGRDAAGRAGGRGRAGCRGCREARADEYEGGAAVGTAAADRHVDPSALAAGAVPAGGRHRRGASVDGPHRGPGTRRGQLHRPGLPGPRARPFDAAPVRGQLVSGRKPGGSRPGSTSVEHTADTSMRCLPAARRPDPGRHGRGRRLVDDTRPRDRRGDHRAVRGGPAGDRRSPGAGATGWVYDRPGPRYGWSVKCCATAGCWCTTTATAGRGSRWRGGARRRPRSCVRLRLG
ncbi:FAD-dependent oxidoreductase [Streptomyces sp. L7]